MTTNKIYQVAESGALFKNTGGDVTFTLKDISNGIGRLSAQWDRGSGALPARFKIEICMKYASAVAIGAVSRFFAYGAEYSNSGVDGGTSDKAVTAETEFNNFALFGQNVASANTVGPFYSSHIIEIYGRYISLGFWNRSGQTTDNNDGTSFVKITPFPDDIQAAA